MTDPSPDCGYTDAEEVETVRPSDVTLNKIQLALDYCVHNHPGLPSALPGVLCIRCQAEDSLARLAAALAEQTRRTDQAWEEIARLREFGEHYSGAAQDAWDRIEVLEKALRQLAHFPVELRTASTQMQAIARAALAAGKERAAADAVR